MQGTRCVTLNPDPSELLDWHRMLFYRHFLQVAALLGLAILLAGCATKNTAPQRADGINDPYENVNRSIAQKLRSGEWISTAPLGYKHILAGQEIAVWGKLLLMMTAPQW